MPKSPGYRATARPTNLVLKSNFAQARRVGSTIYSRSDAKFKQQRKKVSRELHDVGRYYVRVAHPINRGTASSFVGCAWLYDLNFTPFYILVDSSFLLCLAMRKVARSSFPIISLRIIELYLHNLYEMEMIIQNKINVFQTTKLIIK